MRSRKQQTILFGIIGGVGSLLILLTIWLYSRPYKLLKYENNLYGFSLRYPATWSYKENQDGAAAIFMTPNENPLDTFRENVNIVIQDIPRQSPTLREYTKRAIFQLQVVFGQGLIILESKPAIIDGRAAHRFVFLSRIDNVDFRTMCMWTLAEGKAYQITYTALNAQYDKYIGQVKRLVRSFKIGP